MLVLLAAGCAGEAENAESVPADTAEGAFCADAPALTWDTFGHGFLIAHCDGCHAATSPDRHDAPEEVTFDTAAQAWAWAERILVRASGEAPTMPPNGGVGDDDRLRLEWWLRCGVPGT